MSAGQVLADLVLAPRCAGCGDPGSWFCLGCRDLCDAVALAGALPVRGGGSAPRPARGARRRRREEGRAAARRGERGGGRGRSPRARLRDRSGRVTRGRWIVRGLLLFVLAFTNLNDIWSPDVLPNALFAWTVIRERNVDYDEFTVEGGPPPPPPPPRRRPPPAAPVFPPPPLSPAPPPPQTPRTPP